MEAMGVFGLLAFLLVAKLMKDVDNLKKQLLEAGVLKE
jgi:hypothetical protein